ncbi:MAG: hypothetical protein LBJ20_08380 [Candidatus Methanoplasma sp.]|jgi:transposase|nr:hypothetical protein [Candidatus Methanoplasma sp.]
MELWKGLDSRYHFDDTDVDGSAVVFNGSMSEMGDIRYPRDFKDQSRPQVEFMTAQLQTSKIPIFIRPFKGNASDAEQYRDVLPDIFSMIREGSWIIRDNGGVSSDILNSVMDSGNRYLTRVKMNLSDDKRITENKDKWEYAEDGVCCIRHTFDSSGRTTYLFMSADNTIRSYHAAERSVKRMMDAARSYREGKFRKSDFVTVKKNIAADIKVRVDVQTSFDLNESDTEGLIRKVMGPRAGIFKLESSVQLTPREALKKYRARASAEHLIRLFKRVRGLKPLRVWKEQSIKGSMILALLSETAVAMAGYELESEAVSRMDSGETAKENRHPSAESIVWSLGHLTLCRIVEEGKRKSSVYSNWNLISERIFANIRSDLYINKVSAGG